MKQGLILVFFLALTIQVNAETKFYQCTDQWGQPVFSQRPCGADAEAGTVEAHQNISEDDSAAVEEASSSWTKITAARKVRDMEGEIERREEKIERLEDERDAKISELDRQQQYANNNLAGAQYLESLATEMQAVTTQYNAKIDGERNRIERLLKKIDKENEKL
jgi:TolA-binding protein